MRLVLFLLSFCHALVFAQFTTEYLNDDAFRNSILAYSNAYRAQHGAPALIWHPQLVNYARAWTGRCNFAHSGGPYGENLAANYPSPARAVIGWGNERVSYNYAAGQFSAATGHFTQLVWRSSRYVGCSRTYCNGGAPGGTGNAPGWYIACEYYPPGNVRGQFTQNVLPPR